MKSLKGGIQDLWGTEEATNKDEGSGFNVEHEVELLICVDDVQLAV
jgi:hypothetical protein